MAGLCFGRDLKRGECVATLENGRRVRPKCAQAAGPGKQEAG